MVEVKLRGFEEARKALLAMPERIQNNVLRGAVYDIAKATSESAKARAPIDTGLLHNDIIPVRKRGRKGIVAAAVAIRGLARKYANTRANRRAERAGRSYVENGPAFYWRFIEYGTAKMGAQPFLRPALDALAVTINSIISGYLRPRVEKELRKLAGMPKR